MLDFTKKTPKGDSYYDNRAERYERRRKKQDWWHVEHEEMRALLAGLPRGLNVVDVPFGTGRFVSLYTDRDFKISGVDASQDMLDAARKSLGDALFESCMCQTASAEKMPFVDGQFDLVVSTRFLRDIVYFGQAKQMLAEMARITSRYAIIQLGENPDGDVTPADDDVMGSHMSRESVNRLLKSNRLKAIERRLVTTVEGEGDIYHVLCRKV